MRLFICALSLLLCISHADDPIAQCKENNVCALFLEDATCTVRGEKKTGQIGVVWDTNTQCGSLTYWNVLALLEIELTTPDSWRIIVTTYEYIFAIEFSFEHAILTFANYMKAEFNWNSGKTKGKAVFPMEHIEHIHTPIFEYRRTRYAFNISADGENLLPLLRGSEITWKTPVKSITMKDERFSQLLDEYGSPGMSLGMKLLIGFCIGIAILLVVITVICCIVWRRKKRNNSETKKGSTKRSSSSTAQTPKKGKSDRHAQSTDIEGLHTELISKDKSTNVEGIETGMSTKKWNEKHGVVCSKTSTPAIYRPPPPLSPTRLQEPKGAAAAAGPPLPPGFASQTM